MICYESDCVDCGQPCIYEACPHYSVVRRHCDTCGEEAEYIFDNEDFCRKCLNELFDRIWNDMGLYDKAEALGLYFTTD